MLPGEFIQRPLQHGFADDQLAHQVEQIVDTLGVYPQDIVGMNGSRSSDTFIVVRRSNCCCLSLQQRLFRSGLSRASSRRGGAGLQRCGLLNGEFDGLNLRF